MTWHVIAAILISWPAPALETDAGPMPEAVAEREVRLGFAAKAITTVADGSKERAARLMALGAAESLFGRYVLDGCRDPRLRLARCDSSVGLPPKSIGYWQLRRIAAPRAWHLWRRYGWRSLDYLEEQARRASGLLGYHRKRCAGKHPLGDDAGMFVGYGTGSRCTGTVGRLRERLRLLRLAREELWKKR